MNLIKKFEQEIEPFLKNICVNENQLDNYVDIITDVFLNRITDILENTSLIEIPGLVQELKLEKLKRSC